IKRLEQVKSLDVEIGAGSDFYSEVRVWTETENGAANFKGGGDTPIPDCSGLKVESRATFSKATVIKSPLILEDAQDLFRRTGGTHGAGAFDSEGRLLAVMEDVGRHNALDKIIGALLLRGVSFEEVGVVLSGRLALDMILKAGKAGIPLLCSISAPTDLAILTANEIGITLAGFVRGENFNIYSHPSRIVD
ncbi:MAG: formate dehydrogenase accessory sulfurtransferase FdhD, partial [Actinomycetota bacterium]|nr:formate dehydrogenase accessory sulfurtransferase FdhD [Actinomycetota bacterium]